MKDNPKLPEVPRYFLCEKCDYQCSHKGDWNKHNLTSKHLNDKNDNIISPETPQIYKCTCGNEYSHMSGLSRHKKKCLNLQNKQIIDDLNDQTKQQQLIFKTLFRFLILDIYKCPFFKT